MPPTAEDKKELDEQKVERLREIVGPVVADVVEERLARLRENGGGDGPGIEEMLGNGDGDGAGGTRSLPKGPFGPAEDYPSKLSRAVMSLAACGGDRGKAANFAAERLEDPITEKALLAADEESGGVLVQPETQDEVIELLRPASVVRQLEPVMAPMDAGTLRLPKITSGASGGYVGESSGQNASEQTFGSVELSANKYVGIVPLSNDLVRRQNIGTSVERMVRDDIRGAAGQDSDIEFIRGDGSGGTPVGLRNLAANLLAAETSDPTAVTLDTVTTTLGRMLQTLMDADVRMIRVGWIMEPRTWRFLITQRDSNGNFAWRPEMRDGTLFGFPFRVTSQLPRNLDASGDGDGDETELYLADFADVVIGETTGMLIDVFEGAAYQDADGNVVSALSRDESVVRLVLEHDIGLRHDESVVVAENVVWGA